ncbi:hypothetical protein DSO57_1002078 [Entomophthora muscae]|uniref:Uncharacterized protein n=1 Tax=Entomophthora muscae TaxID=34485 RepID=A0ACC2RZX7_9FUNG|nr:hypothetical protein DSO57_1002078 [Entomophthora muscae]
MNSPLVIAMKFQTSIKEAILWLEENASLLKQIQMRKLPCTILPLLQLSHGRPPDLPFCLLSLMKPRLSVTPEAYLQKLPQVLINTEAEVYHAKLNINNNDVDHAFNSHSTLPLYKVGDAVYFYSNRGYGCEKTLIMLWQGPIKANQKMDPVNYTKNPNTGHLITRVHTKYMCAAPSACE